MTETEKAIDVLFNSELATSGTTLSKACHIAVDALREKQEREKGCEMYNGRDVLLLRKAHKYCKYCGRRLKE
jgi:hypothetical protein